MLNHIRNQLESLCKVAIETAAINGKIPKMRFIILYLPVLCITYLFR